MNRGIYSKKSDMNKYDAIRRGFKTFPHNEAFGIIELQQPFKSFDLKGCFYDLLRDGLINMMFGVIINTIRQKGKNELWVLLRHISGWRNYVARL
jgi:hypothetical protein